MEKSKIAEWHLQGDIGILTLSNPPQNYLNEPEFVKLSDLKSWTENDSLRGIIIQGKGRHFCAGFNKEEIFKITEKRQLYNALKKSEEILYYLEDLPIPVVAAITGVCFGAGMEIVLSCDIRVCSEKALLSFPETEFGIIPGFNGMIRLPKQIRLGRALELIMTGRTIQADEALSLGIVDHTAPPKKVFEYAQNLLAKYTANTSIPVLRSAMMAINNARKKPRDVASAGETKLVADLVMQQLRQISTDS